METVDDIIENIKAPDRRAIKEAKKRQNSLTKPSGSLGRLEEIAIKIAGITGNPEPELKNKIIFTFAGDHGVVKEGISAYPQEVTSQMVSNFINGGAAINVLARHVGARVVVADLGVVQDFDDIPGLVISKVGKGTKDFTRGEAMPRKNTVMAIKKGIEIFEKEYKRGIDIVGTGDMGIGNTTSASAIAASFSKAPLEEITGRGTGIDDKALKNKVKVIKRGLEVNRPDPGDPLDVLSKVGGYEIAGLVGVILAAASKRVPVIVDGFISTSAALVAGRLAPQSIEYMISAHKSFETGHRIMLDELGLKPLLELDMRLGEGTGAALGISIIEASVKLLSEMATFEEAGVSEKKG